MANQNTARNPIEKIPPRIPTQLPPKQVEEVRKRMEQRKNKKNQAPKSYAQASSPAADVLKLKDAFLTLPNKKIIEIHNASLNKTNTKGKKIQYITKGPSRKQAIVSLLGQYTTTIMNNAGFHVSSINSHLKGLKSTLQVEFIRPTAEGIIIATNNIPASSDLSTMEKYIKSIEDIGQSDVSALHFPQLKTYLKIIGIPYIQPSDLAITSNNITNYLKNSNLFEDTTLAARPALSKHSQSRTWPSYGSTHGIHKMVLRPKHL